VLVGGRHVRVGDTPVVLDVLPVVEVRLLVKLLRGLDLLDADLPLDRVPALVVPVHQRVAGEWDCVPALELDMVCREPAALQERLSVLPAILAVGGDLAGELEAGLHVGVGGRRHCDRPLPSIPLLDLDPF